MSVSRPEKLTHTQTILYEIDMLRRTAHQLRENKWQDEMDKWGALELFLLHFRNLIEFFGKPPSRDTDLSIHRPETFWEPRNRPSDAALASLRKVDLWTKYEGQGVPDKISKYLQHCTEQRVIGKTWEVGTMYNDLSPTVDAFEKLLSDKSRTWTAPGLGAKIISGPVSASTATVVSHSFRK